MEHNRVPHLSLVLQGGTKFHDDAVGRRSDDTLVPAGSKFRAQVINPFLNVAEVLNVFLLRELEYLVGLVQVRLGSRFVLFSDVKFRLGS